MNIAKLAIERPVFVVMIILSLITLGIIGYKNMGVDLLPDVEYPTITVITIYAGASAEEIENLISKPIEDALSTLPGLDSIVSTSKENISYVTCKFGIGTDIKYSEMKVKEKVDLVKTKLPEDIEEPKITRFSLTDIPVIALTLTGKKNMADLKDIVDDKVKPELEKVNGVGKVEVWGGRERAVFIYIDKSILLAKAISINQIFEAIKKENLNIPVGSLKTDKKNIKVRVKGQFENLDDINNIPIRTYTGEIIKLKDIAQIKFDLKEEQIRARAQGENAIRLGVYKQSGENTVAVAKRIKSKIKDIQKNLDIDTKLDIFRDPSHHIEISIKGLQEDILLGALFAMVVVFLFLGNFRSTIITAIALPNSLIGAFFFISNFGFTINLMVLLALSLCIGLLIDDSIVVRENIFRYMEKGLKPVDAALRGTNEVALAVIATTASIMAVFIPISFLQGVVGQYFKQFGLTVAFALTISLIDAFTTAPMLSAYWYKKDNKKKQSKIKKFFEELSDKWNIFYEKLNNIYKDILIWALERKMKVLISIILLFFFSFAMLRFIGLSFLPDTDYHEYELKFETYPSASLTETDNKLKKIEEYISLKPETERYFTLVGSEGENTGRIYVKLNKDKQKVSTQKYVQELINYLKLNYGQDLIINQEEKGGAEVISGGGDSASLVINVTGPDIKILEKIARDIKNTMLLTKGVSGADVSYKTGKPQITIKIDRTKAAKLGISSYDIGMLLNSLIKGGEISKFKKGEKEYDIILKIPEEKIKDIQDIKNLTLTTLTGKKIPLGAICDIKYESGPIEILRENKKRVIKITGNLEHGYALGDVINLINENISKNIKIPDGYEYAFAGQATQMTETITQMTKAMFFSLIFMYMILASLYNSFVQPLILMLSVPLAVIGAFLALILFGIKMDVMAMIGILMVLGLVAKNGILLIDFTNQKRKEGLSAREALLYAGPVRLRPILMTTFAMIFGMLPLALGFGEGPMRTKAMPIAVIGGLLTSTFLTLVVIPIVYEAYENLKERLKKKKIE
ncbi:MAG: efflux RND transporter permease subunit [Candidatus Goldbacteria bacterium]|nr:efflux RND transporter permease subunit [Candidatus Goldiibacteriota bacterium]